MAQSKAAVQALNLNIKTDKALRAKVIKTLHVIDLACRDCRQHVNAAIDSLMSTRIQVFVNLSKGAKQNVELISLIKDLKNIYTVLVSVIGKQWGESERSLKRYISDWLKNAKNCRGRMITKDDFAKSDELGETQSYLEGSIFWRPYLRHSSEFG